MKSELVKKEFKFSKTESNNEDYIHGAVPIHERRSMLTMGLLWITMVTCFPNVLVGFQWFKQGMSISQVITGVIISCLVITLYSIPACYLGSKTGLTYGLLSRSVFGNWGAKFVSLNVIWVSTGWYALNAIFLADGINGLFHIPISQIAFAAIMAVLMAFNNFFGFSGVANFARYLAAPVLVAWVAYAFCKAGISCPSTIWSEAGKLPDGNAITIISSFVIGIACWGNEADYWRFGKAKWSFPLLPVTVSLLIGQIIFPITGWMLARLTGITDFAAATKLMNEYVFGGFSIVSALVLLISYIAVNDAGLYAAINNVENLATFPRKICVALLALGAAIVTVFLSNYKHGFEAVAALSCIFLPCATMIMLAEAFVVPHIFKNAKDLTKAVAKEDASPLHWSAIVSLLFGCVVGTINAGFIEGTESFSFGIPSLHGWLLSFFAYLFLRPFEFRNENAKMQLSKNLKNLAEKRSLVGSKTE